jgi:hypothetical protein
MSFDDKKSSYPGCSSFLAPSVSHRWYCKPGDLVAPGPGPEPLISGVLLRASLQLLKAGIRRGDRVKLEEFASKFTILELNRGITIRKGYIYVYIYIRIFFKL